MSEHEDPKSRHSLKALGPEEANLSEMSVEELRSLKDAILARARERVGPEGFNPVLQDTSGGGMLTSGDEFFNPWDKYILVASIVNVIRVLGEAVFATGSWIATANILGGAGAERYGGLAIGVSMVFSAIFLVEIGVSALRPVIAKGSSFAARG
jgi:hypothetical protein